MFEIGDKVHINNINQIGHIEEVFDTNVGYVYIVKLEDRTLVKVLAENLEPIKETAPGAITINREDFKKAFRNATDPKRYKDLSSPLLTIFMLMSVLLGSELEKELFND